MIRVKNVKETNLLIVQNVKKISTFILIKHAEHVQVNFTFWMIKIYVQNAIFHAKHAILQAKTTALNANLTNIFYPIIHVKHAQF
jgi:hypothetical protein